MNYYPFYFYTYPYAYRYVTTTDTCVSYSLDNLGVNPIVPQVVEKKEKKMFNRTCYDGINDCDQTVSLNTESVQRDYILGRLAIENDAHYNNLEKQFGLVNDQYPKTAQSFVDRILTGKYILKDNKDEPVFDPSNRIIWRDPSIKEDRPGFDAAVKVLDTAYKSAKDTVVLGTLDEGKATLSAFQQWTYKPTIN